MGALSGQKPRSNQVRADHEGNHHSDDGDRKRTLAHAQEFPDIGFQADLEKKDDYAELGHKGEYLASLEPVEEMDAYERKIPQGNPHQELAQHRRLTPLLDQAGQLGGYKQEGDPEEQFARTSVRGCGSFFGRKNGSRGK